MTTETMPSEYLLLIKQEADIAAPPDVVFESLLEEIGPEFRTIEGQSLAMKIEPWPGGRWFRDLGNNSGHLWGHVQVIKPPKLLEICGPLMMSFAAFNHAQWRLSENGRGTRLAFAHRAIGEIPAEYRDGMPEGWDHQLKRIRQRAESKKEGKR